MAEIEIFTPLLIEVQNGRWVALPMAGDTYTVRDQMLLTEIKTAGGIDQSTPNGFYHFNIIPFNGIDRVTLLPVNR